MFLRVRLSVLISAAPAIFLSRELRVPDNFIVQAPATLMRAYSQSLKWMFPSLLPAVSICVDFVLVNPRFSSLAPAVDIVVLSHDKFLMLRLQAPASLPMNEFVDNESEQIVTDILNKIADINSVYVPTINQENIINFKKTLLNCDIKEIENKISALLN